MAILKLARHAMATRFEIVLCGENPISLRAAGEEALNEIERLENQLSLFRPTSEIAHLNVGAAREPMRVSPAVFGLLDHARKLTEETGGAFDVTIAPFVRCWGFMNGSGQLPAREDVEATRAKVGMHLVHLDPDECTVRFEGEGVMLDLGAIGKGYAIDCAVDVLREAGVTSALVHGGTSTVYGLGHPPESDSWKIEIPNPSKDGIVPKVLENRDGPEVGKQGTVGAETQDAPFATVLLRDSSLSVSAIWGKFFRAKGRTFGHIIDPRTGEPASNAVLSAVVLPSATETDALSTALLTLGPDGHDRVANLRPEIRTLVVAESAGDLIVKSKGIVVHDSEREQREPRMNTDGHGF
jgi:thiamine biosynthesis lipoprotein